MHASTRFPAFLALLFIAMGCASEEAAPDQPSAQSPALTGSLSATGAFARPALEGANSAMYVTITNGQPTADTLLAAELSVASMIELHETFERGEGMRGMRELADGVPLGVGETVALEPGGKHVMLMNLTSPLTTGDTLAASLVFSSGQRLAVEVPVQ